MAFNVKEGRKQTLLSHWGLEFQHMDKVGGNNHLVHTGI